MTRAVSRPRPDSPNVEMSAFGYLVFALTAVVMIPLLPFLVVVWAANKLSG